MSKAVFGIFQDKLSANRAVESLKEHGFDLTDISVLAPNVDGAQNFVHVKESKAPEAAATGAGTGAIIGGAIGLLAGIGVLAIPGVGALIAAGPIMAVLAGLGVGGTVGGLSGLLIGLGIPEYEAKRYEGYVKNGGLLLSVHAGTSDLITSAKKVLEACGAKDISYTEERTETAFARKDRVKDNHISNQ